MRMLTIIVLLICLSSLSNVEAKSYTVSNTKGVTSFPFSIYNNIIIVDVLVNQSKTLKFIFDSGCKSTIVIKPHWIDSFTVDLKQKVYFVGLGLNDSIETVKMNNSTLQLGVLLAKEIPVYLLSKDTLNLDTYLGTEVDGIFGAEIFEKFYVHINYKTRLIELYTKKPAKKIKSKYSSIPVSIRNSKGYANCVIMNANNSIFEAELLFDTGANIPIIIKNKEPQDLQIEKFIDAEIGNGLAGAMYSKVCRVKKIFLDTFKFAQVVTAFSETPITVKDIDENTLDGNIGNDILSRFDMYFAYPENKVYLKTNKYYDDEFEFNISNIILLENRTKNNGFIVKSIATNSPPLLAGLQIGDEIIKIESYKAEHLKLEEALALLNRKFGKNITIQLLRNNVVHKISYKLISII